MDMANSRESEPRQKQAACLECRRSKTKCIRTGNDSNCRKCTTSGAACVVPPYHIGRYKGVKNKRTGLDKAISQVQNALKKSRGNGVGLNDEQTLVLDQLLRHTHATADDGSDKASHLLSETDDVRHQHNQRQPSPPPRYVDRPELTTRSIPSGPNPEDAGDRIIENADNPLQLLAIASELPAISPPTTTSSTSNRHHHIDSDGTNTESETQAFFRPIRSRLDVSPDLDPVDLGLVTEVEAERLIAFFHNRLAHTRWGLDSKIHTSAFVRARSALLFTSVMAAAALFLPETAALSTRLRNHTKQMVRGLMASRYRSVEIVLALMINIPWMAPGQEWAADDDTCYTISMALTIALDLSMNKLITPTAMLRPPGFWDRVSKADCIEAARALALDGFDDVDPASSHAKRLLRTRERVWLALYNLDKGVCLARGRPSTVPVTPLIETCDTWHICEIAEEQDGALTSATVLRREVVGLITSIRNTCDNNQLTIGDDATTIKVMRDKIENFFEQWHETWKFQIQRSDGQTPPYIEILASHTKLSAYCSVIAHPTAPADVKQFFRAAGLASALNVLKVAVQAESRLVSMPNNTVIMVSFAACFVLGLSNSQSAGASLMAPNTRDLIEEVADVLERIGSSPSHRHGASVWFGRHIRAIVRQSPTAANTTDRQQAVYPSYSNTAGPRSHKNVVNYVDTPPNMPDSFEYSNQASGDMIESFPILNMTNDQIIDAITNAKDDLNELDATFQYDDFQFQNWFDAWG